ncbi:MULTISPECIES: DUF6037 family protein [Pseudomonas]|uniref:DUF6037 family protein n=1 Tax=Pseudomonas TaxID=286 RepID=UPI000731B3CC|nr:DUF6037 family protein [Pseudomonas sp. ICMP 10191]KTB99068.1 hypothetical protein AO388_00150 [Pseudomonas sp. ICMP 10191]
MTIVLNGLRPLQKSMRMQEITRQRFTYHHLAVEFDVYYFIDETPNELLFGAKGHNFAFTVIVKPGFEVFPYLKEEDYFKLREILGIKGGSGEKFSITAFIEEFNLKIPTKASSPAIPEPHEISSTRDVDEAHKRFFFGWRNNDIRGEKVTAKNLHKTKELLGVPIYESCLKRNVSSKWTDIEGDKKQVVPPPQ